MEEKHLWPETSSKIMGVEKRLVRNFLSARRSNYGVIITLSTLAVCFVMSNLYWHFPVARDYLAASPSLTLDKGQYWRLFTTSFIHGDLEHLLSNSFMLTIMGYFVSSQYGARAFPLLGFTAGALINLIVLATMAPEMRIVGASGVVYFLWGYWLILYILIQRHLPLTRRLMKVCAVGLFILVPSSYRPNVSYLAHAVGLLIGIGLGTLYFIFFKSKIQSYEVWEDELSDENDEPQ